MEEQKQAIIHQSVTGQIDVRTGQLYAAYKDSGIERLCKVPVHWEVKRMRTVASMRISNVDKHIREEERSVRLCNYVDVYKNSRVSEDLPFMWASASEREIEKFRLAVGDVLVTKDSEDWNDIGVPALVEYAADDLVCGYHLAILRPKERVLYGPYLHWALQSDRVAWQIHVAATGVTRYGLSQHAIRSVRIPLPPLCEQRAIAGWLDKANDRNVNAATAARREIRLLEEYRTRLIADVVTGMLDVRGRAAATPEELDEPTDGMETIEHDNAAERQEEVAR